MDQLAVNAFIIDNDKTITQICRNFWRKILPSYASFYSLADYCQDVREDVMNKFSKYRAEDSKPATWIWWRARKVADKKRRRFSSRPDIMFRTSKMDHTVFADTMGNIENVLTIKQALSKANPGQLAAALTLFEGMSSLEIKENLGVQRCTRDKRLKRLGETIGVGW